MRYIGIVIHTSVAASGRVLLSGDDLLNTNNESDSGNKPYPATSQKATTRGTDFLEKDSSPVIVTTLNQVPEHAGAGTAALQQPEGSAPEAAQDSIQVDHNLQSPEEQESSRPRDPELDNKRGPSIVSSKFGWWIVFLVLLSAFMARGTASLIGDACSSARQYAMAEFFYGVQFDCRARDRKLLNLAQCYEKTGQLKDAERLYAGWVRHAPQKGQAHSDAQMLLAAILDKEGKYQEADSLYGEIEDNFLKWQRTQWSYKPAQTILPANWTVPNVLNTYRSPNVVYIAQHRLRRLLGQLSAAEIAAHFKWTKDALATSGIVLGGNTDLYDFFRVTEVELSPQNFYYTKASECSKGLYETSTEDQGLFDPDRGNLLRTPSSARFHSNLPSGLRRLYDQAVMMLKQGHSGDAFRLLNQVISECPQSPDAYVTEALTLWSGGHSKEASYVLNLGFANVPSSQAAELYYVKSILHCDPDSLDELDNPQTRLISAKDYDTAYRLNPGLCRYYRKDKLVTGEEIAALLQKIGKNNVHKNKCCNKIAEEFFPGRSETILFLKSQVTNRRLGSNLFPASPQDLVPEQHLYLDYEDYAAIKALAGENLDSLPLKTQ